MTNFVTLKSNTWVTLEEVKRHLDLVEQTKWDNLLSDMINDACDGFEKMVENTVLSAAATEYYDGDGTSYLLVRRYPIISVTSIHVDSNRVFGAATLIDSDWYQVDSDGDIGRIIRWQGGTWSAGTGNIKLVYAAGYASGSVPGDLKRAIKIMVEKAWVQRGAAGLTSESTGSYSAYYDVRRELPAEAEAIVDRYRRWHA